MRYSVAFGQDMALLMQYSFYELQKKQLTANKPVYMAFVDLEKKACL